MTSRNKETRYVTQDGADFYIFRDSAMKSLQQTWTYAGRVVDVPSAQTARKACIEQLEFAGYEIQWPNPFHLESNDSDLDMRDWEHL